MEYPFEITVDNNDVKEMLAGKLSSEDKKSITEIAEEFSEEFLPED